MFLQSKAFDFCAEKQSEGTLCRMLRIPSVGERKRRSQNPPKGTPKLSSGAFGGTQKRVRNWESLNVRFSTATSLGGMVFSSLGPGKWHPGYI